jgi:hypothetical protein
MLAWFFLGCRNLTPEGCARTCTCTRLQACRIPLESGKFLYTAGIVWVGGSPQELTAQTCPVAWCGFVGMRVSARNGGIDVSCHPVWVCGYAGMRVAHLCAACVIVACRQLCNYMYIFYTNYIWTLGASVSNRMGWVQQGSLMCGIHPLLKWLQRVRKVSWQ